MIFGNILLMYFKLIIFTISYQRFSLKLIIHLNSQRFLNEINDDDMGDNDNDDKTRGDDHRNVINTVTGPVSVRVRPEHHK